MAVSRDWQPAQESIPGLVITGFVLSVLGCPLIGAILCFNGRAEAKRRNAGVGLATAGIVLGIVQFAFLFCGGLLAIIGSLE